MNRSQRPRAATQDERMKLMKCRVCGDYTMKQEHHGKPTVTAHPIAAGVGKHIEQRIKMRSRKDD